MKSKLIITLFAIAFSGGFCIAQDAVPKAKTRAERKAGRKKMTLEQRIEEALPVDVDLPSAKVNLPEGKKITNVEEAKKYVKETLPEYKEKAKKLKAERKKKKSKSDFNGRSFKGLAVQKRIYKRGAGNRMQYIEFYTLRDFKEPDPYLKSLFWFDERTKKIVEAQSRDKERNHLLHGPYKAYVGESLVESGNYYLGVKDGRWESYDGDFVLLDKVSYNKGFLAESKMHYYDESQSKIKEVVPFQFGKQTGAYLSFYETGEIAEKGEYDNGVKVGRWIEYYTGNRQKRVTQYGKDCYDTSPPKILREYTEDGKMTYEDESVKRM